MGVHPESLRLSGFEVVAHCASATGALRVLKSSEEIDVVLLDLDLGQEHGADFLDQLRRVHFNGKVLLATAGVTDSEVPGMIRKGISGVFLKHGSPASLAERIRDAAAGKVLFGQDMLRRASEEAAARSDRTRPRLTEGERQMLSHVFEGLANKQIADRLEISETAVKASLQQLFAKTGVTTQSQLVRAALERYRDQR